jgi:hypothetical protein
MYVITKYVKPVLSVLPRTSLVSDVIIPLRKPFDEKGRWIGWTEEEVKRHLEYIRKLSSDKKRDDLVKIHIS